jgi:4-diphosphocytidyl-2-C-methyl-D-erythritol kinase
MPDKAIKLSAPCKLNLHLRVLERRSDGFHDIESVFQLISLADSLSVSISGEVGECVVFSPAMDLPPVNTITRAVEQFRLAAGIRHGVRVTVDKQIPSGAGLGGGSSDAAVVLKGLDALFGTKLPPSVMHSMAANVGSDVPFFLAGPAAVVTGRGEIIRSFASRTDLFGVLLWPGIHSSTAEAYALVDDWQLKGKDSGLFWPRVSGLEKMYRSDVSLWQFGNSFTSPLVSVFPVIGEAIESLLSCGASFAQMSGSGSAVYGLFGDEKQAAFAHATLSSRWKQCVKFLLLAS